MSTGGQLATQLLYLDPYRPYIGFNHHYTRIGFHGDIMGGTAVADDELWYTIDQGDTTAQTLPAMTSYDTGIATSGGGSTLTNTGKAYTVNAYTNYQVRITAGTGVGQKRRIASNTATVLTVANSWTTNPDNTSVYAIESRIWARLNAGLTTPCAFLPHNEYTIWTKAVNPTNPTWNPITKNYININAYLAGLPGKVNSITPRFVAHDTAPAGTNYVTIQGAVGDLVRLYWKFANDEATVLSLFPATADGYFQTTGAPSGIAGTNPDTYRQFRGVPFYNIPLASGIIGATGSITLGVPSAQIPADRTVVCSAESNGMGESFGTAAVGLGSSLAERQIKTYYTQSAQTRTVGNIIEAFYTIECRLVNSTNGAESVPSQAVFKYSKLNNGADYVAVTDGIWLEVGKSHSVLIIDQFIGTGAGQERFFSGYVTVPGAQLPTVLTPYADIADALNRGPNVLLAKDESTYYSIDWNINSKVWLNDNVNDGSVAPDGYYWVASISSAIRIVSGLITTKTLKT